MSAAYEFITGWWCFLTFPTHIYRHNAKIFLHVSLTYTKKKRKINKTKILFSMLKKIFI